MDILELLKQRLQPLYPQMQAPAMPDQHTALLGQGLAMNSGGSDLGQAVGDVASMAGNAYGQHRANQPQKIQAEKMPLGTADDLTPRQMEPMSEVAGGMGSFGGQHKPGTIAPAAGNPAVEFGQTAKYHRQPNFLNLLPFGGARRHGGYVHPRRKYLVGENGPEMFVPEEEGDIVPLRAEQQPLGTQADLTPRQPEPVPQDLSQFAQPQQTTPAFNPNADSPLTKILSRREKLESDIAAIEGKDYSIKKDEAGNIIHRGKDRDKNRNFLDILKSIGIGALRGGAEGGLPGLVAGAATGGIMGAVDRNYDEKAVDEYKLNRLRGELDTVRGGEMKDAAIRDQQVETQARIAKSQQEGQKLLIDAEEKRKKAQFDALKEALGLKYYDPKRPDHRAVATQAGIDPDEMQAYDDRNLVERQLDDGTTVKVSGDQALRAEIDAKQFDATKIQDIEKFNIDNQIKVQEKNISNEMKYQDDVRAVLMKTAEAHADLFAGNTEAQIANQRVQAAQAKVAEAAENGDTIAFDEAKKEFDAAADATVKALGKAQGGAVIAEQLKAAMPKRPTKITYTPARPTTVNAPAPVSVTEFVKAAKREGLSGETLKRAIEQAKKDGVIR